MPAPLIGAVAPGFARARPKALGVLEYSGSWAGAYLLRRGLFLPHELPVVMDAEIAREGLRRLKPLHRLAASLMPDPSSDVARVCVLESAHYMRNQLLRDADWAGMAHSLEIRVPLVDFTLLAVPRTRDPGAYAGAWARRRSPKRPSCPLPNEILTRAKSGFSVPTGGWMNSAAGALEPTGRAPAAKGLVSRRWSRAVLNGAAQQTTDRNCTSHEAVAQRCLPL